MNFLATQIQKLELYNFLYVSLQTGIIHFLNIKVNLLP